MAPGEDKGRYNNILCFDLSDTETEPPDDHPISPRLSPGGKFENQNGGSKELQYMQDTMPVDDVDEYGEAFETQVVEPDDEIPILDFGEEIQLVNLAGDTQMVEELNCVENVFTQVVDDNDVEVAADSDGEVSDRTEALCDTQEVSEDDSVKRGSSRSLNQEDFLRKGSCEREDVISKFDASTDGEHQSGYAESGFTSIRAASIRASGLAARKLALERTYDKPSLPTRDCSSLKHAAEHTGISHIRDSPNSGKEINRILGQEGDSEQMKGLRDESRSNVCRSAVRKLFSEDTVALSKQPDDGMIHFNDAADLPQFEDAVAGLSYVNSQEPGELSQVNALDFVDEFVKVNVIDFDVDHDIRRSSVGKTKVVSSAKGTQNLVKTAILGSAYENNAIFDWDVNHEDEGGGDFFQKKKDLFFDNGVQIRRSLTQPRKRRCVDCKGGNVVENCGDEKEDHLDTTKKLKNLVRSESRIGLLKKRGRGASSNLIESFNKEFNDQLKTVSGEGLQKTCNREMEPELLEVGPDTQMAAEAIETLCFGVVGLGNGGSNAGESSKNMSNGFHNDGASNKVHAEKKILSNKARSLNALVITRQSKRTNRSCAEVSREDNLPSTQSKNVRSQYISERLNAKAKRTSLGAEKCYVETGGGNLGSACSEICERREKERPSRISELDESNGGHVTASSAKRKKTRHGLPEQLGSFSPVAHRTRQCRQENQINAAGKVKDDSNEEMNDVSGVATRRKRSNIDANASKNFPTKETNNDVEARDANSVCSELSEPKCHGMSVALKFDTPDYPKGRRTPKKLPPNTKETCTRYKTRSSRLRTDITSTTCTEVKLSASGADATARVDSSPRDGCQPFTSACTTPVNCSTPVNAASPICMGDEYLKQSCRKRLTRSPLMKEVYNLIQNGVQPTVTDSRRRRDISNVRTLFSQHLDPDTMKQQKKILARLGASEVSSMSVATHFITDKFVRTRNMLEAIALGKPVVTHLWLESCGQASCLIDEKNFILRDAKKEKEIGFSMPASLARACQQPLLQGQRVLITNNTKPGKEILASLVKAVRGLPIERLGRSALKDEKLQDDLLILSCEEDYDICLPFLEKGAAVYSSELLLNGIVTQKLEYDRHQLFLDHIKRTRSTMWVKKNNNQYLPVTRLK